MALGAGRWQTPRCGIGSTTGPNRAGLSATLRKRSFDKDSCYEIKMTETSGQNLALRQSQPLEYWRFDTNATLFSLTIYLFEHGSKGRPHSPYRCE
jgi:hypothetical protein